MTATLVRAVKEVNVMDFSDGADIDGGVVSANDAFAAAIAAATGDGGPGKLVIPAPETYYLLDDTVDLVPSSGTQLFLDIEAHGPNGSIRFTAPNKPVFHSKGWKHSTIEGVKVNTENAALNAVVWEVDGDGTYTSSGELTFRNCLNGFGTGGANVGWRFGKSGGSRDFSVIKFETCQNAGTDKANGDIGWQNLSLNGLGWEWATCGSSFVHTNFINTSAFVTCNGGVNNSVTSIPVNDSVYFPLAIMPSAGVVQIDSERILYTGKSSTHLTGCTRGYDSTSAASHSDGASVWQSLASSILGGGGSMTFINGVNSYCARDYFFNAGGAYKIDGGRYEVGGQFIQSGYGGTSPSSIDVSGVTLGDYAPADETVVRMWCPTTLRWDGRVTRSSGAHTAAFFSASYSGQYGSIIATGQIHAADPCYTIAAGTAETDFTKCVRLSGVNTTAGHFS